MIVGQRWWSQDGMIRALSKKEHRPTIGTLMRTTLLFSFLCASLLIARSSQAEQPQTPPASDAPAMAVAKSPAPAHLPLPPSGRAMALAGGILGTWGTGLFGVGISGAVAAGLCNNPFGCESQVETGATIAGAGFGGGGILWMVGGPLLGVGIHRTLVYKKALRAALNDPLLHEAARTELLRNVVRERNGMIASGVLLGVGAVLTISSGVEFANDFHRDGGIDGVVPATLLGLTTAGSMLTSAALFSLSFCAGNYMSYQSLLTGASASASLPPVSALSLTPIVSNNLYGLSLSGRWN